MWFMHMLSPVATLARHDNILLPNGALVNRHWHQYKYHESLVEDILPVVSFQAADHAIITAN